MRRPWLLATWLLVLEVVVILLLVPGDLVARAIERESVLVEQNLGADARGWIEDKASRWFRSSIVDSGFYAELHHMLIPTEEERARSRGLEGMGRGWFQIVESRIDALMNVIYQFYARMALLTAWVPYMLILFLPAIYDGLMTWRIKRTNFDYASPIVHRYSVRGTVLLLSLLFIAFFAPIALNPVIIPVTMMACCVLIGLAFGNLQKRV